MCQRKGGFGGVKRGQGNHTVPLPPFAPRRGHGVPPPVNTGSLVPPKAAIVHAHFERKVASGGEPLYRLKVCRHPTVKQKSRPALARAYPILLTARCTACSARFAACCAECRSDGFSIALAATMLITAPATAPVATPDTNGDTCILFPPFFAFFQRCSPRRSLIMSRRARFLPPSALTKSTCKIRNILRNRLFTKTLAYSIMIENTVAPFTVRFGKIRL